MLTFKDHVILAIVFFVILVVTLQTCENIKQKKLAQKEHSNAPEKLASNAVNQTVKEELPVKDDDEEEIELNEDGL